MSDHFFWSENKLQEQHIVIVIVPFGRHLLHRHVYESSFMYLCCLYNLNITQTFLQKCFFFLSSFQSLLLLWFVSSLLCLIVKMEPINPSSRFEFRTDELIHCDLFDMYRWLYLTYSQVENCKNSLKFQLDKCIKCRRKKLSMCAQYKIHFPPLKSIYRPIRTTIYS